MGSICMMDGWGDGWGMDVSNCLLGGREANSQLRSKKKKMKKKMVEHVKQTIFCLIFNSFLRV